MLKKPDLIADNGYRRKCQSKNQWATHTKAATFIMENKISRLIRPWLDLWNDIPGFGQAEIPQG